MRIDPEKTVALFIDYQERLMPAQYENERCIENAVKLAKGLMALNIPIVASEQYPKGLGSTVEPILSLEGFPAPLDKTSFSCMLDEGLKAAIKDSKAKNVIIAGCETHVCVLQTIEDLIEMGYCVYIVEDCCSSRTLKNHNIGMDRIKQEGAFITSLESILFELLQKAGGDTFKFISNLIK